MRMRDIQNQKSGSLSWLLIGLLAILISACNAAPANNAYMQMQPQRVPKWGVIRFAMAIALLTLPTAMEKMLI
jgi:hypothetical protein